MTASEAELMRRLEAVANEMFDGHLTVMKFTTDWRVSFETPSGRDSIAAMASGKTFREAAKAALASFGEENL